MQQIVTIPQQELEVILTDFTFQFNNPNNITCRCSLRTKPSGSIDEHKSHNVAIKVNQLFTDEISHNNLTTANINGFKKCIKAIGASAIGIAFNDTNDIL